MGSYTRVSETREVRTTGPNAAGLHGSGHGSGQHRPKWLWGWVGVYVLLGILALVFIGLWISADNGVQWENPAEPRLMFNYHPLFMILGFLFISGMTNLIYRMFPDGNVTALKITHSLLQLTAFILMCCGVYAVGWSKDYGHTPHVPRHFTSVHSWCGLTVLIIMALQWVCGFFGLLVPGCRGERRHQYRTTHIFTGNLIFLLGSATVLIGIDSLSKADSTLNTLALTVIAYAILGAWFLSTGAFKPGRPEHVDATTEERAPLTSTDRASAGYLPGDKRRIDFPLCCIMARSRFSHEEVVRERVDVRVNDEGHGTRGPDSSFYKRLVWWCATYIFLALLALILIVAWCIRSNMGYAWKDFAHMTGSINYHGTFMIVAFVTLNGIADVLYRMCRNSNRLSVKIAHATIQTFGFCFIVTALCAVFWWHDARNRPNLQSTHSWIGLLIVLLYALQWVVGFFGLLFPGFRAPLRASYLPYHKFTGRSIFLLAMANTLIGLNKVSAGSSLINCLALIIILYTINGGYLLGRDDYDINYGAPPGYNEDEVRRSSGGSRHSGGHVVTSPDEASNMYINIAGTQGTGHYQAMAEDPAIKEAMAVGRDTFSKFHDRLERKKNLDLDEVVHTKTVVTE
ncbi:uncharacterized protein LOC129583717 [Paramacrobiotus metropolitanus]|uniref:uncharacterized protein LOC129583717 n=1 Tax=Paramacrobiotus metropolitanus TaxID=2943436 RepID=UPI002445E162|nr:uncharacterized protein LOC129583717 [Paramacrobiotus metropolitanus]